MFNPELLLKISEKTITWDMGSDVKDMSEEESWE